MHQHSLSFRYRHYKDIPLTSKDQPWQGPEYRLPPAPHRSASNRLELHRSNLTPFDHLHSTNFLYLTIAFSLVSEEQFLG